MTPFEREVAASMANAAYLNRALDQLFTRRDPGMSIHSVRADLIAANLPIDAQGKAIVENDDAVHG